MKGTLRFIAGAFLGAALHLFGTVAPASAQDGTTTIYARAGQPVIVGQPAACVRLTTPAPDSDLGKRFQVIDGTAGSTAVKYLLFTPLTGDTAVEATVESGTTANGAACEPATLATYRILTDRTPEIPQDSLNKSFTILLTAFVLALLLESAFALLFNWRLFLEFFVGKAWRTPIMFAGALIVVRYFDLDLMAKLFAAYNPPATGSGGTGNWFTSIITAMILAGGSIGVNRILVGLGFRSQARQDVAPPQLDENEAWVSVLVRSDKPAVLMQTGKPTVNAKINIEDVALPTDPPPATVGFIRPRSAGRIFTDLLFPNRNRLPQSGGKRVLTTRAYRITVETSETSVDSPDKVVTAIYDATTGKKIDKHADAALFRFGSRAIVDLEVNLR